MSVASNEDGKKWIQTAVAVVCMILGYVLISFFQTLSDWFELESKITGYHGITQFLSVVIAIGVFVYIIRTPKISTFLDEVWAEVGKVVFPDKKETGRHTIGIMIGVSIVGFLLGIFDFVSSYLLSLIS